MYKNNRFKKHLGENQIIRNLILKQKINSEKKKILLTFLSTTTNYEGAGDN